jgi:hypothetical protein
MEFEIAVSPFNRNRYRKLLARAKCARSRLLRHHHLRCSGWLNLMGRW